MLKRAILGLTLVLFGKFAGAEAVPMRNSTRGEMLYSTHCIACHNTQIHWRTKNLVTDLSSLQSQVDRWQGISRLHWNDQDIDAVMRYLNALYYHYPLDTD